MLAHFFKGDDSLKGRVPTGIHGPQAPEAMVALTATLVSIPSIQTSGLQLKHRTL
jgi:hypothetical protein